MNNLKLVIGTAALAGTSHATSPVIQAVSSKCRGTEMSPEWYYDLIFCGLDSGSTTVTRSNLLECVDALTTGEPTAAAELVTLLGSSSDACTTCAVTFANDVRSLRADTAFEDYCVFSETWIDATSEDDVVSIDCLNVLYEPISAFNTCTKNGYDLVTAAATTRCSTDAFVGFEKDFRPWSSIVYQAVVATSTLSNYADRIGSDFESALGDLDCASCFDDMYTSLANMSSTDQTKCASNTRSSTCLSATAAIRAEFALCTGGHAIHTGIDIRCDATEADLFDTVYRPYYAYVSCAKETTIAAFTACVDELNGLENTPESSCDPCYDTLIDDIVANWVSTCTNHPFYSSCVEALNAKDGALREFAVCTGFEMNYEETECSADELAALTSSELSFPPMLINAKYAADQFAAGVMIEASLLDLQAAINGITCENCFNAFVSDAYQQINNSTNTMNCTNPYTAACETSIADITSRFTTCSGATLSRVSADLCTTDEYAAFVASGLSVQMLELALTAATADEMIADLDTMIADSSLVVPCNLCMSEMLRSIVALSDEDKLACADIADATCAAALEEPLAAFADCSGSEFEATTIATTAVPVTTTTAAPTTKASKFTAVGVLFISSILLICL